MNARREGCLWLSHWKHYGVWNRTQPTQPWQDSEATGKAPIFEFRFSRKIDAACCASMELLTGLLIVEKDFASFLFADSLRSGRFPGPSAEPSIRS